MSIPTYELAHTQSYAAYGSSAKEVAKKLLKQVDDQTSVLLLDVRFIGEVGGNPEEDFTGAIHFE